METFVKKTVSVIVTFFGSGFISKRMPGTIGSAVATIFLYVLPKSYYLFFTIALILFVVGIWTCQKYVSEYLNFEDLDPHYIVIDEACAIFLCNAFILLITSYTACTYIVTFALFRLFDIWKPYPINKIEKYCKSRRKLCGFGIMIDDIVATVPTVICSYLAIRVIG